MSHDYMLDKIELVIETLSKPEFVVSAYTGEFYAIKKINTADLGEKSCIVIYHDKPNGFVITSLLTSKPEKFLEKGDIIWKQ